MLPKAQRLNSSDVRRILKTGRRTPSPLFSLSIGKKEGKKGYAVVVSSKITGSKVKRNRIRRLVYQSIKSIFPSLLEGEGVVFVLSDISSFSQLEINRNVISLFVKSKMLPPISSH